ncbi:MAG: YciI family protein [Flaviflexus sp.]
MRRNVLRREGKTMPKFLISFPSSAMNLTPEELEEAVNDSHAVWREAVDAGVWVFGGAIDKDTAPVIVEADGAMTRGTYPDSGKLDGGFAIFDVPTYEEAVEWAAKIAKDCKCPQELRIFSDDPEA